MQKQWVVAVLVTAVLTSGAWAFVGQEQGFAIGAVNVIHWPGGMGSAGGSHDVMFGQEQTTGGGWHSPFGQQKETGVFTQVTSATGGPAFIVQSGKADGGQEQGAFTSWGSSTNAQGQQMGVDFATVIVKPHGAGAASAAQGFVGGQTQVLMTPTTWSAQSQVVGVTEYASVVGGPCSCPTVSNTIKIDLTQGQLTTVPCVQRFVR